MCYGDGVRLTRQPAGSDDVPGKSAGLEYVFGTLCAFFAAAREQYDVFHSGFRCDAYKRLDGGCGTGYGQVWLVGDIGGVGTLDGGSPCRGVLPVERGMG